MNNLALHDSDDYEADIGFYPVVKEATFRDCHRLASFLERQHERLQPGPRFVKQKVRKTLQVAVSNPRMHRVWLVEIDGEVEGALIAVTNQVWYSNDKEALDMAFVVSERGKGYGGWLVRRFLRWARREAVGVRQIVMSESIGPDERLGRLYGRLGFRCTGGVYHQEVRRERTD